MGKYFTWIVVDVWVNCFDKSRCLDWKLPKIYLDGWWLMTDTGNYPAQLSPILVLTLISKFQWEIMNPGEDQIKTRTEVTRHLVREGHFRKTEQGEDIWTIMSKKGYCIVWCKHLKSEHLGVRSLYSRLYVRGWLGDVQEDGLNCCTPA